MSSWVQLLALLMAACVRFGGAEGDPLPAALVELVRTSPISSIEDLQLLLLSDSTDEDLEGSPDHGGHSNNTINRHPRSLDAQPAQQALCKIRTVVTEVTRAMLDRSNAHFLLWPPCVEVQRCSGCCNTKTLQCVPVLTHTRHLQVMKIQYINKQPTYAKAVVSVVDHVECRCQPAPRAPATPKKKPSPHTPPRERQGGRGQSKGRSKEELHHGDELKHNQRLQLEELLEQHWSPKESASSSSSSSSPGPGEGGRGHGPAADTPPSEGSPTQGPPGGGGRAEAGRRDDDPEERRRDGGANGTGLLAPRYAGTAQAGPPLWTGGEDTGQESVLGNRTEGNKGRGDEGQQETQRQAARTTDAPCQGSGSPRRGGDASSEEADQSRDPAGAANQRRENRFRPTAETNQGPGSDNDTPESEGRRRPELPEEQARLEEERKELLRLHRRLDQEKEQLRLRQREEEEAEGRQQQRQRHKQQQQQQQQTTTQIADTASPTSTRPPPVPAGPRPPARPAPARKRMRKNRKRISKAAMRAMLM